MSSAPRPRMIVPDVARGMALLGIAMANMTTAWIITTDRPASYFGGIIDGSVWDKAAVVFLSLIHISEPTRLSLVSRMPSSA